MTRSTAFITPDPRPPTRAPRVSEFYSLRRNAITDISAFFGFLIGFLGSSPVAYPYLRVGFQTQEIVKGFTWFIGITFGTGIALAIVGMGVGRVVGWFWENSHKVVRRARGQEFAVAAASPAGSLGAPPVMPIVHHAGPADVPQPAIRYAPGVDAQHLVELFARSAIEAPDPARLRQAMMVTTNIGAWDGHRLVGAIRVLSDGYEWTVVTDIIVDPAYRRRGIGRELMHRAAGASTGKFTVARIPPGTEGFFRSLDALPAYDGFVRGAKSRLQ
jgi:ribosomal protein S18 acetylase RimI-like enzyme